MFGKKGSQSDGMLSFVITVVFHIITSLYLVQIFNSLCRLHIRLKLLLLWHHSPTVAQAASLLRLGDLTQLATPHSVGFLWTRDRSVAEAYIRNRQTPMHPAGFEPTIPTSASSAYLRLRPRECWNQHYGLHLSKNISLDSNIFNDFIFIQ